MDLLGCSAQYSACGGGGDFGSGYGGTPFDRDSYLIGGYGDVPRGIVDGLRKYDERVANARADKGFRTNEEIAADAAQQKRQERQRRSRLVPLPVGTLEAAEVVVAAVALAFAIAMAALILDMDAGSQTPQGANDGEDVEKRTPNDI